MNAARGSASPRARFGRVTSRPVRTGRPAVPPALRRPVAIMAVLAALVTAVLAVSYSDDVAASWLDTRIQAAVELLALSTGQALVIDLVGELVVAAALVCLLAVTCLALGRCRLAVLAVAGPGLTGGVTTTLKPLIDRTIHGGHLAYPSGHTAFATALALVVTLLAVDLLRVGRWSGLLLVLAGTGLAGATMAWAQLSLGAHYPTDTVGGFCTAIAVVPATALLIDWFVARRRSSTEVRAR